MLLGISQKTYHLTLMLSLIHAMFWYSKNSVLVVSEKKLIIIKDKDKRNGGLTEEEVISLMVDLISDMEDLSSLKLEVE